MYIPKIQYVLSSFNYALVTNTYLPVFVVPSSDDEEEERDRLALTRYPYGFSESVVLCTPLYLTQLYHGFRAWL